METPEVITFDMVEAALAKLNRRKRNPERKGICLYTDPRNPERHCIVGQIWANLGVPVPDEYCDQGAAVAAAEYGTLALHEGGLINALGDLQEYADARRGDRPRAWGLVIDAWPEIRSRYREGRDE